MIKFWPGSVIASNLKYLHVRGRKQNGSDSYEQREVYVYGNGFLLQGTYTFVRDTLYILIYAKGSTEKMKGFILFVSQGITNSNNSNVQEKIILLLKNSHTT